MSIIVNISTVFPPYRYKQSDLAKFMCELFQYLQQYKRKLKLMYAKSGINSHYCVISYFSSLMGERIFFPKTNNLEPFPTIEHRMQYFNKTTLFINKCKDIRFYSLTKV